MFAFASHTPARTASALVGTVAAALLCLGAAAGPAKAAPAATLDFEAPRSVQVSVAGIDLNSDKGQAELRARLRAAARSVCHTYENTPQARIETSRCAWEAMRNAAMPVRLASTTVPRG